MDIVELKQTIDELDVPPHGALRTALTVEYQRLTGVPVLETPTDIAVLEPPRPAVDPTPAVHIPPPIPNSRTILDDVGIEVQYITDDDAAREAIVHLLAVKCHLGLDIETAKLPHYVHNKKAGLDPHLSQIRLIQLYDGGSQVFVFDLFRIDEDPISPLSDHPLVAHNATFELKHLYHAGIELQHVECSLLAANALYGTKTPLSLAALAKKVLSWELPKTEQTSDWGSKDLTEQQIQYAALDAVVPQRRFQHLHDQLQAKGLLTTYRLMRDAQVAISQMEMHGIHFDADAHETLIRTWEQAKAEAEAQLRDLLGPDVNPASGKQLSDWLLNTLDAETASIWPRTATGHLKTDAATLKRCQGLEPLLRHKEFAKLLCTYGEKFRRHLSPATGRIHPEFCLTGTATGRLPCRSPNIQNPPRDSNFRSLFCAPPGRLLVVADYSQIELRVAALVSGDKNMLEAYRKGEDLHRRTAAAMAGIAVEEVTSEQRQAAKAVNFGLLYGQGPEGLARYAKTSYGVDMTLKQAQEARQAFFKAYPQLRAWQQETANQAKVTQRVKTPGGRVRDFTTEPRGYRYTEALNTPIQGGAAEVMLAALAHAIDHLDGLDAILVNVVHDELVVEVAEDEAKRAANAIETAMTEGMLACFSEAATDELVEVNIAANWGEAK